MSKSSGPHGISARMLKSVAQSIAPSVYIARLVNQSIQSGCFPVFWKSSNIVPIPKLGDSSNPKKLQAYLSSTYLKQITRNTHPKIILI